MTLPPGGQSALRHWHTLEDEFVYVLEGELALVTDAGEQTLHAGDCAGYPAGKADGHHFVNRSGAPASYLEVGNREEADTAHYPDDDIQYVGQWRRVPAQGWPAVLTRSSRGLGRRGNIGERRASIAMGAPALNARPGPPSIRLKSNAAASRVSGGVRPAGSAGLC